MKCCYESAGRIECDYRRRLPDPVWPADLLRWSLMVWPIAGRYPLRKRASARLHPDCFDAVGFAGAQFGFLYHSPVILSLESRVGSLESVACEASVGSFDKIHNAAPGLDFRLVTPDSRLQTPDSRLQTLFQTSILPY